MLHLLSDIVMPLLSLLFRRLVYLAILIGMYLLHFLVLYMLTFILDLLVIFSLCPLRVHQRVGCCRPCRGWRRIPRGTQRRRSAPHWPGQ